MSIVATKLFDAQYAPTSATTLYFAPNGKNTIVDKFTANNVTAGAVTITVYLVPFGGTAGTSNAMILALSIAANTAVDLKDALQNHILNAGDFISALSGTASAIVVRGSGREVT